MTLSIGNVVRKVNPANPDEFIENEAHIIFEVTGLFSGYDPEKQESVQLVRVKPVK